MKTERQIQVTLAMLRRESDHKRVTELLNLMVLLKNERIGELERQIAAQNLKVKYGGKK